MTSGSVVVACETYVRVHLCALTLLDNPSCAPVRCRGIFVTCIDLKVVPIFELETNARDILLCSGTCRILDNGHDYEVDEAQLGTKTCIGQ